MNDYIQKRLFSASQYDGPTASSNASKVQTLEDRRTKLIRGLKRLLSDAEGTDLT